MSPLQHHWLPSIPGSMRWTWGALSRQRESGASVGKGSDAPYQGLLHQFVLSWTPHLGGKEHLESVMFLPNTLSPLTLTRYQTSSAGETLQKALDHTQNHHTQEEM